MIPCCGRILGLSLLVAAAGCNDYVYKPAENSTALLGGRTAAVYNIPEDNPQGHLRLASYGISKIQLQSGAEMRAMHLRVAIENNSDQILTFDTQDTIAYFRELGEEHVAFAQADYPSLPTLAISPRTARTVDLYFPLPPGAQNAGKIPAFDVAWNLSMGTREVYERTPFERLEVAPEGGQPYYARGPFAAYDPWFGPGFLGPPAWYWY